ncbi:hypothetical protein AB0B30_35455 [Streptomyces narbonensis]|uniref:Uncharacterized protein n=1 Tax=Streptomyces narbonensis TaxID=67333 RepID=A0ABV3CKC8_9ACTN
MVHVKGLSAYVYTEFTDVEGEYNGLFSYDRRVQKVDTARLRAAHGALITASRNLNAAPGLSPGGVRPFRVATPGHAGARCASPPGATPTATCGTPTVSPGPRP